ncbi:MAG: NUDIX hydrolase, partial [Pseudomonadota bacterium]
TLRQAAVRELIEETGVGLPAEKLTPFARVVSNTAARARLYHFIARLPLPPESIPVQEGAGFGFLTPRQLRGFPVAWPVRDIVRDLADRIERGEAP